MLNKINTIAHTNGWSTSTIMELMLEHIESCSSEADFISFLNEKANKVDSPLGLSEALESLEQDPELELFESEIGVFDINEDPSTPFDSHTVIVASEDSVTAKAQAENFVKDNILIASSMMIDTIDGPNSVSEFDYL